jgi:hypothetical protein
VVAVVVRAAIEAAGALVAGVWPGEVEDDGVMGADLAVVKPNWSLPLCGSPLSEGSVDEALTGVDEVQVGARPYWTSVSPRTRGGRHDCAADRRAGAFGR